MYSFEVTDVERKSLNDTLFNDLNRDVVSDSDILRNNEEFRNFIYPVLTQYTDEDRLKILNNRFGTNCKHIQAFSENVKLEENAIIKITNKVNNYVVISTLCNMVNYYKKVFMCNLYLDDPMHNIHYVILIEKNKPIDSLKIITNYVCTNSNLDLIYYYLYVYYESLRILRNIFTEGSDDDGIYANYCKHFAIN